MAPVPARAIGSETVVVFLSSTWEDLQPERRAIETVLNRIQELKFVGMEYFGSQPESTLEASLQAVDRSALYIAVIGGRYGSGITEAEYRRARANDLPCLIYARAAPGVVDDTSAQQQKLALFLADLRRSHTVASFNTADDLLAKVAADVNAWLFKKHLPALIDRALASARPDAIAPLVGGCRDERELDADLRARLQRAGYAIEKGATAHFKERDLRVLADRVRQTWVRGVLEQAVAAELQMQLRREREPEAVERPWSRMQAMLDDGVESERPSDDAILRIFADASRFLLILGEPGSGKSVTLFELTRDLLHLYDARVEPFVPVVLNIASWRSSVDFITWAAQEIRDTYLVPYETVRACLVEGAFYLMLDGLDEVPANDRDSFVESLNEYLKSGPPGVALTCRVAEYHSLARRVQLFQAIRIAPLTDQQIEAHVARLGPAYEPLRERIGKDADLRDLARSPFMLNIMGAVLRTSARGENAGSAGRELTRAALFELYLARMFRRGDVGEAESSNLIGALSWLAGRMQEQSLSVFSLDRLQPAWLQSRATVALYAIVASTFAACALVLAFVLPSIADVEGEDLPYIVAVLAAAVIGSAAADIMRLRLLRRTVPLPYTRAHRVLVASILLAYLVAPIGVLTVLFLLWLNDLAELLTIASTAGLLFWASYGVRFGHRHAGSDVRTADDIRWSWPFAVRGALFVVVTATLIMRLFEETFVIFGAPDMAKIIRDVGAWLATAVTAPQAFVVEFINVRAIPLCVAGAVLGGFRPSTTRRAIGPYGSILATARRSLLFGVVTGISISVWWAMTDRVGMDAGFWETGLADWWTNSGLGTALVFVGTFAGLGVLWFGGFDLLRHAALRLVIRATSPWPFACITLLDRCARLALVRRAGPGYVFIHRMLLDYLADLRPVGD